jgi:DNA polymerase-3 subunit alpha
MSRFVHLHAHSDYSFLEALPKVEELVATAKKNGMPAIGLTDSGNMHGAIEFYKAAEEAGIKPILGVDTYVAPRSRFEKDRTLDAKRSRIVLLAENMQGYKNLLALVTKSYVEGFFDKPRVDKELLREHREGIIAIIPSFAGEIPLMLAAGDTHGAGAALAEYQSIFAKTKSDEGDRDNLFLEITHHPSVAGHEEKMQKVIALSKSSGVPLLAQHDVYYLKPDDREACEVMRRIQHGAQGRNEQEDFSFISEKEAIKLFKETPEAIDASVKIADRCNLSFELGKWIFPNIPTVPGMTHEEELRKKTFDGLVTRTMTESPVVLERIEYELGIINQKGFAPYFLAVSDLLTFAKSAGILTTTRGSAAGSLVGYLTGITNVDPLYYKLPFERFLNPERPKAPDIDMDIADNRRDEMIAYAKRKYGEDHVAQIGTFGTLAARAAVRDVARALGHSYSVGDRIAKLIPIGSQGFPMTIERALKIEKELKLIYDEDEDVKEVIDLAQRIEGCVRHVGVHAAGVVISPTPLIEWTPLQPDPKSTDKDTAKLITQYDMYSISDEYGGVGLLKFDFLGIKNLSILSDSVQRVQKGLGITVDIETIPIDDTKTFEMLARGETEGLFQLNGSGMTRYLKELKPTTIHDINAMVALYRPGPMDVIPSYIDRKNNPSLVKYLDPRMEKFLKESYGLLVYQDDLLYCAVELAGYSWLEVDKFRKAIGKKNPVEMAKQKKQFTDGIVEHGQTAAFADKLWLLFEPFQAYGFNKCLTADTRIYDGVTGEYRTISELLALEQVPNVVSLDDSFRLQKAVSSKPFENGVKEIFELRTRSGRTIRATANHPFLAWNGWTRLDALEVGTRIAVPRILPSPTNPIPLKSYEADVLGYLLSEGNLCHPHGIYFYSTQEDELQDFIRAAERFSNSAIKINRSKSAASVYIGQKNQRAGNELREYLKSLNLLGKRATEKLVPSVVWKTDDASLSRFLGKLWQGDGSISVQNEQVFYATSSEQLAHDVQSLLLRLHITSTIHTKSFKYRGTVKTGWTIVVSGVENLTTFSTTIGQYMIGNKFNSISDLVAQAESRTNNLGRGTSDTLPKEIFTTIRGEMALSGISAKELSATTGMAERLFYNDPRKKGFTRETVFKMATAIHSTELLKHAQSDIFWDEVVSIKKDGKEMTYDLSVPAYENFIANNMIVHNSHAASYGKVAYQTAYMKANYPFEYMAALLTADSGDTEQISTYVDECVRMKISVLPPDINESGADFTVATTPEGKVIRFGLTTIKNFGEGISEAIIAERTAHGPYESLSDFLCRVNSKNLHKKGLESLIKCGALDRFADEIGGRAMLMTHIELLLAFHRDATTTAPQDSLFGAMAKPSLVLPSAPEDGKHHTSLKDKLAWEKELLGIYVSGHPLDAHADKLAKASVTISEILADPNTVKDYILPVLVAEVRPVLTKGGEKMAFVRFEDKTESIEAVVFPRLLKERAELVNSGTCLLIKGKVSTRNGETSFAVEDLKAL